LSGPSLMPLYSGIGTLCLYRHLGKGALLLDGLLCLSTRYIRLL
ncbi:TPA_asm: hypothetical protein, partial [ssRNA phage Gephyllon.1_2]